MDYQFMLSFIAFMIFCMISCPEKKPEIKNIRKKIDDYKSEKFYENTYLYHIPNSRIVKDLK